MDATGWLASLGLPAAQDTAAEAESAEPPLAGKRDRSVCADVDVVSQSTDAEIEPQVKRVRTATIEEDETESPEDSLVALGFERDAVLSALAASAGDLDEALVALRASMSAQGENRPAMTDASSGAAGETVEIEGVQCALSPDDKLRLRLPHDPVSPGPIVGRRAADGAITFDGMDEWLWELYDSHPPRSAPPGVDFELPRSFDAAAVQRDLDRGAPYVWEGFASEAEIKVANAELEAMFSKRQLVRGSSVWVDECAEGGHARNRRSLEGQRREDACGFWDLQGNEPAPPPGVMLLFRRLEAAAERLRAIHGWPVLCSRLGMGAVYDGQGACYSQHRDNEWQRHLKPRGAERHVTSSSRKSQVGAWMNFRELTMLAYVNLPGMFEDDEAGVKAGGRLRCYVNTKKGDLAGTTAEELQDVAPRGGRAVIFRSRELLHEVLSSHARRYCLTLWFQTVQDS